MGSLRAPYSRLRRRGGFFPGPGFSPGSASFRAGSSSASSDQKLRDPCLLLSNDDGVEAPGLLVLAERLRLSTGMRCVVVAPDGDRSGAGMALTLRQPMALKERPDLGPDVYAVGGTPADCALCALDPGRGLLASLGLTPKTCRPMRRAQPLAGTTPHKRACFNSRAWPGHSACAEGAGGWAPGTRVTVAYDYTRVRVGALIAALGAR